MRYKLPVLLLLGLLMLVACNKSGDGPKIVGKWHLAGVQGVAYEFKPDGTFTADIKLGVLKNVISGKYSSTEKDLTMTATDINMTSTDPDTQAKIDAGKQLIASQLNKPITVALAWKSDDEFTMSNTSGWLSMGAGPVPFRRAKG